MFVPTEATVQATPQAMTIGDNHPLIIFPQLIHKSASMRCQSTQIHQLIAAAAGPRSGLRFLSDKRSQEWQRSTSQERVKHGGKGQVGYVGVTPRRHGSRSTMMELDHTHLSAHSYTSESSCREPLGSVGESLFPLNNVCTWHIAVMRQTFFAVVVGWDFF